MKTLGIIGGMSPESTVLYYQTINRAINARLDGNHSAPILIDSLDFANIVALQNAGDWHQAGQRLAQSGKRLQDSGADLLLLATNTMHKVADAIEAAISIPFLHIIDATAAAIKVQHLERVGLLGTAFTMQDGFYHQRMNAHGINLLTPKHDTQTRIHRIIFEELCRNRIEESSRTFYQETVHQLQQQGAQGVILGCTEIGLLLDASNSALPVFDSARLHALAAVEAILDSKH